MLVIVNLSSTSLIRRAELRRIVEWVKAMCSDMYSVQLDWRIERGQPWKRPLVGFWLRVRVPRVKNRWGADHVMVSIIVCHDMRHEGCGRLWGRVVDGVGLVCLDLVGT